MVQIIPAAKRKPTFGEKINAGLSAAAQYAGQYAEQSQQQQMQTQQRQKMDTLGKQYGINNLGSYAPEIQKEIIGQKLRGENEELAQQQSFRSRIIQENQNRLKEENELQKRKSIVRDLEKRRGLAEGSLEAYENDPKMAEVISRPQKEPTKTQASQPIDPQQLSLIESVRDNPKYANASPLEKYQMMTSKGVSKENAKAEADIAAEQAKPSMFESEASKLAAKSSSEVRDSIVREYEGSVSSDLRIDKMMKDAKSGKLSTPLMIKTLDFLGLPLSVLRNPTTEEYAKLQNDYVRDVSKIFPGAIKNFEIESYLKTIPTLLNSDEGKVLVGNNIKLINKAVKTKYSAMKDILKENQGVVPRNLDIAVNDRIRDELEEIRENFINGISEALDIAGPKIPMKDKDGNIYDINTKDIEDAIKEGLIIYNE